MSFDIIVYTRGDDRYFFQTEEEALRFIMRAAQHGYTYAVLKPELAKNSAPYKNWTNYTTYLIAMSMRDDAERFTEALVRYADAVPFTSGTTGQRLIDKLACSLADMWQLRNGYDELGKLMFYRVWGWWNPTGDVFYLDKNVNWREIFMRLREIIPIC